MEVLILSVFSAIVQGLIQGFTEFLPVSSSGHLSLFQYFTGISSESSITFSIMLHLGTLAAVCIAFWKTIWELLLALFALIRDIFTLRILKEPGDVRRRMLYMLMLSCVPLLIVPFVQDFISGFSSDNSIIAEGVFFLITALLLTLADRSVRGRKNASTMTAADSLYIGFAQLLATLPGISRSGSTISAGLIRGLDKGYAVAYSFILGLPAVLAAALLDFKDAAAGGLDIPFGPAVVGMLVSAVSGLFAIKLVSFVVKSEKFRIFAVYTAVLGLVVLGIGISEPFTGHAVQRFFTALFA